MQRLPENEQVKNNRLRANNALSKIAFGICAALCLSPFISPVIALALGIVLVQLMGNPYHHINGKATQILLQASVVALGFGINMHSALRAGKEGLVFTTTSLTFTLVIGYLIGKLLRIENKVSLLISSGTAICGGSAIAALSPVIKASEKQISVALGCVFILNAIALFIFPAIGHYFHLSQIQFGLWCAIAIHDTSSVVGAAARYGPQALAVATTVKLARALWIIPVAFASSVLFNTDRSNIKIPYFIILFIMVVIAVGFIPAINNMAKYIVPLAKPGLTLTLFLIGTGMSRNALTSVGAKPFILGLVLWIAISAMALFTIMHWG